MRFGAHLSTSGGAHKALVRAHDIGADGVQIFTQSPRMWRSTPVSEEAAEKFRATREELKITDAIAHALYLINLASIDPELHRKSTDALVAAIRAADALGLDAVVLHIGSHKGAGLNAVMEHVVRGLTEALDAAESTYVLVENAAGHAGTIGQTIEELAQVLDAVGPAERLGICIDSCHWFASGVDVSDPDALDNALAELDSAIGIDRLRCLHLNDSKTPLGSHRDRHANIGEGEIGDGLSVFLSHPKLQHLAAFLETPGSGDGPTADELIRTRELHARGIQARNT